MDAQSEFLLSMNRTDFAEMTAIQLANGDQRFSCPLCKSVKYTQMRYLKAHIKECGLTFSCQICQQNFKQKRTYTQHLRSKHSSMSY